MTSRKTVVYLLFVAIGVISFLHETDAGRLRKTKFSYNPPRLQDYVQIRNEITKKPGDKKWAQVIYFWIIDITI